MDILTKEVSSMPSFDLFEISLMYRIEELENSESDGQPCWRFAMKNRADNQTYKFYVNALTGKITYMTEKYEIDVR